ncbi:MAG: hypothetical protein N4A33_13280 [Bacteriovoracaceae bacterium]|jgi:hypothetical protein|nr:hypothetical protein [Bacteriovoracaceae bacterium]
MIRILIILVLSSCALIEPKKFEASQEGLKKLINYYYNDLKFCSSERLLKDKTVKYYTKVNFLINKMGRVEKIKMKSTPLMSYGVNICMNKVLKKFKFHPPKDYKAIRLIQSFYVNSL